MSRLSPSPGLLLLSLLILILLGGAAVVRGVVRCWREVLGTGVVSVLLWYCNVWVDEELWQLETQPPSSPPPPTALTSSIL